MRITLGDFGNIVPPAAPIADTSALNQAAVNVGNTLGAIGHDYQAQQLEFKKKDAIKQQELGHAKDANNFAEYQFQVKKLESDFTDSIASGELPYDQARQKYDEAVTKIPALVPNAKGQIASTNLQSGQQLTVQNSQFNLDKIVSAARDRDLRSQGAQQLDTLGKQTQLSNANVDQINQQGEAVVPLLRQGGMTQDEATRTVQNFKDANWFNNAKLKAIQNKDNYQGLTQLAHDLTADDGYYAQKLDTDKRNAVLSQVVNQKLIIENRQAAAAAKREAGAQRTVNQFEQQIASGVPATPDMWDAGAAATKGTQFEQDFKDLRNNEVVVQQVLRQPIDQQLSYVQTLSAKLDTEGGTLRDKANLQRLAGAVQQNVKTLQTAPLVFAAQRTGTDVQPLDFQGLMGGDSSQLTAQVQDRMTTLTAMRKQYGNQVQMNPLLPQEAAALSSALETASPKDQTSAFSTLYSAMGSPDAYRGAMQQLAPDQPIKALAGMLAAKQATLPLEKHWFSADVIGRSPDIAATMLQGQALLSPTKVAAGQDGKPKTGLYLPETKTMQADFQNAVGNAFAGRPAAAETAFQAVQAYYVGKAAQSGRLAATNADIDGGLVKEAIRATLGEVVDYNGRGQVLAPWGMDQSTFEDRVHGALLSEGQQRGFNESALGALRNVGLRNLGDGTYYVTSGKNFVLDPKGHPLVINVTP